MDKPFVQHNSGSGNVCSYCRVFSCRENGGYKRLILWSAGIAVADMCCNLTFGGWIPYFIHDSVLGNP